MTASPETESMEELVSRARRALDVSGAPATVIWSPGRVNLIGDHIDYSGGLVLPMALDRGTSAVAFPRPDDVVRGYSANFAADGIRTATLATTAFDPGHGWFSYVLGVVAEAARRGLICRHGFDLYLTGTIPEGGGLSSSASVEMAVATALESMFEFGWDATQWAVLCRAVENDYIGVASGIMDQLAIGRGRDGMAILMDCATLQCDFVPVPDEKCTVLVANSRHRRTLADSSYNDRRAAVERAREIAVAVLGDGTDNLAAVSPAQLENIRGPLEDAEVWPEALHTVTEQARVVEAAAALAAGDVARVGALMRQSHESLRDDFRVTGPQLDALAEVAWQTPGVIGARMTGAGFGGCAVILAEPDAVDEVVVNVTRGYAQRMGVTAEVFPVRASSGSHVIASDS